VIVNGKAKLSSLISPRRDVKRPIYNWHAFKHSYSKEFVDYFIDELNLKKGDYVFDPFVGGGTTLLACKERGINAIGIDILPFSVFLSNAKTSTYDIDKIQKTLKHFIRNYLSTSKTIEFKYPDINIVKIAFNPSLWNELNKINFHINKIRDKNCYRFFKLALLSILEKVGNASKAGGFLRIVENNFNTENLFSLYLSKIDIMIEHLKTANNFFPGVECKAIEGDARSFSLKRKFDAIITSPPYPNRHDYTRIYGLELVFGFIKNNQELKSIRYKTLRSHVEAKRIHKLNQFKKSKLLNTLLKRVKNNGTNNVKILDMLEGYFEDMYLVFKNCNKILKQKGRMILVVSNVRFSGINIAVDKLLSELAESCFFTTEKILIARHRGNSSQQMKKYKKNTSRESVLILTKAA